MQSGHDLILCLILSISRHAYVEHNLSWQVAYPTQFVEIAT
ncbi:hypothetical protein Y11_17191 [Yersinia enterocolitica subsp. palearctica Y11]|uniref:Uncharacterized protein n=2 Tax=Yersinia enterocolitica TaxID=630 RepID=A0A0H3NYN7_YERE1|nr:hypothetical protein FORC065_1454 [Yersinia enterocolitica]CBX73916.1 unknown protein [Yersinia enterocolitica W22703]CBY26462.1 hypothetical protein Y11_17191 [Yersinia enterocolitica subsp. palearctica Y11]